MRNLKKLVWLISVSAAALFASQAMATSRADALRGSFGTYDSAPRLPDGRVDQKRLLAELADIHANTYNWLFRTKDTDLDDLKTFLPLAREKKINVWATLVPPSETLPKGAKPTDEMKADYEHWITELAKLSATEPNFVAWSVDDFPYNQKFWTPEDLEKIVTSIHQINTQFAFVPCCYYKQVTPAFVKSYIPLCDAILFPYRDDSAGGNLENSGHVRSEVEGLRQRVGPGVPIIVDVYATSHSRLGASTPSYVAEVMQEARASADGVLVYCHQHKETSPSKYGIIKRLFTKWAAEAHSVRSPKATQ